MHLLSILIYQGLNNNSFRYRTTVLGGVTTIDHYGNLNSVLLRRRRQSTIVLRRNLNRFRGIIRSIKNGTRAKLIRSRRLKRASRHANRNRRLLFTTKRDTNDLLYTLTRFKRPIMTLFRVFYGVHLNLLVRYARFRVFRRNRLNGRLATFQRLRSTTIRGGTKTFTKRILPIRLRLTKTNLSRTYSNTRRNNLANAIKTGSNGSLTVLRLGTSIPRSIRETMANIRAFGFGRLHPPF